MNTTPSRDLRELHPGAQEPAPPAPGAGRTRGEHLKPGQQPRPERRSAEGPVVPHGRHHHGRRKCERAEGGREETETASTVPIGGASRLVPVDPCHAATVRAAGFGRNREFSPYGGCPPQLLR